MNSMPLSIRSVPTLNACVGSVLVSSTTSSSEHPSTPPALFISSTATSAAFDGSSSEAVIQPLRAITIPILSPSTVFEAVGVTKRAANTTGSKHQELGHIENSLLERPMPELRHCEEWQVFYVRQANWKYFLL